MAAEFLALKQNYVRKVSEVELLQNKLEELEVEMINLINQNRTLKGQAVLTGGVPSSIKVLCVLVRNVGVYQRSGDLLTSPLATVVAGWA